MSEYLTESWFWVSIVMIVSGLAFIIFGSLNKEKDNWKSGDGTDNDWDLWQ